MNDEKPKSRRYCRNCGFRIERTQLHTGRVISGPFWRETWVHADNRQVACMWHAEPKRRGSRTLYQQISDARAAARRIESRRDVEMRIETALGLEAASQWAEKGYRGAAKSIADAILGEVTD